jgi:hypothetical protein
MSYRYALFVLLLGCAEKNNSNNDGSENPEPSNSAPTQEPSTEEPTGEPTGEPSGGPSTDPNDEDNDGDGFSVNDGDCNDDDETINPAGVDYAFDQIDQDCSGSDFTQGLCNDSCSYADDNACDDGGPFAGFTACEFGSDCSDCGYRFDIDEDGYYDNQGGIPHNSELNSLMDCDDENPNIHPDATDVMDDGIDQDCDGEDFTSLCDNSCSTANNAVCEDGGSYSSEETCTLGTDCSDCGARLDLDGDGYDSEEDCDDEDPDYHPGLNDFCNGIDDNCNGIIDEDHDTEEPNDMSNPNYIGSLEDGARNETGILSSGDLDAFTVHSYDGYFSSPDFQCDVTAPTGMSIFMSLYEPDGTLLETATTDLGGMNFVEFDPGLNLGDNTGTYMLTVELYDGESCDEYTVTCYYN